MSEANRGSEEFPMTNRIKNGPKKSPSCLLAVAIAVGMLTLIAVGLALAFSWNDGPDPRFDNDRFSGWLEESSTWDTTKHEVAKISSRQFIPSWSADGSHVVFVLPGPFGGEAFYRYLAADTYVALADGTDVWRVEGISPSVSPDGSEIAYVTHKYQRSSEKDILSTFLWGDLQPVNLEIELSDLDGSDRLRLTNTENRLLDMMPAWSPDGSRISFVRYNEWVDQAWRLYEGIYAMNRDGTEMRRIVPASSFEWRKDGESIVARENFASSLSWSPRGDDLAFVVEEESDRFAYASEMDSWVLYVVKPDGSQLERLFESPSKHARDSRTTPLSASWSPDGGTIALFVDDGIGVKIMSVGRDSPPREIFSFEFDSSPQNARMSRSQAAPTFEWSPDGSRIMFSYGGELFLINADGENFRKIANDPYGAFSPDGSRIAVAAPDKFLHYYAYPEDAPFFYTINADGSNMRALVNRDPDGGLKATDYRPRSFLERAWENVSGVFQRTSR